MIVTGSEIASVASPGEFVDAMADVLSLPRSTVVNIDRNLVIAGLRSKHGRGHAAAQVTFRDAAHLLTAVLASAQVKDAVASVRRYRDTQPVPHLSSEGGFGPAPIAELAGLSAGHSVMEGIEALFAAAASGSLEAAAVPVASTPSLTPVIDISALTPGTLGEIRIAGLASGRVFTLRYAPVALQGDAAKARPSLETVDAMELPPRAGRPSGDLEQYRRVSEQTVFQLARLLV